MTHLARENLFNAELPAGAAPACAELLRLEALTRQQRAGDASPDCQSEARAAFARLTALVQPLRHTDSEGLGSAAELKARFVESVLLWMKFWQTSSVPLVDSLGTRSIRTFPIDLPPDADAFLRLKGALSRSQGIGDAELEAAENRVEHVTRALDFKLAITRALADQLASRSAGPRDYADLMRQFYGELPFRSGDVDFVLTSTGVFFVLPIAGEQLDVPDWQLRPEAERDALRTFLARLARENLTETWRFPSFGLFVPERLERSMLVDLSERTGRSPELVQKTLTTMVSVLPKADIDQYLVHDAWGHTWQEVLNEFEWEYALLRDVSAPLSALDGPKFGGADSPTFASAFRAPHGTTLLDETLLLKAAEADLRGRFQVGLSQALSEVLADFVEAKFSCLYPGQPLPTSSLLAATSLKFDLTVQDVLRQARRCHRPYNNFWSKASEQELWVRVLVNQGLPENGTLCAVQRAASLLESTFGAVLRPVIAPPSVARPGEQGATLATRALLELALLCHELERVLADAAVRRAEPAWSRPEHCPDLWAVSVSHMYEADRQRRFWCLDTLVREAVRGACQALGSELGAPGASSASG